MPDIPKLISQPRRTPSRIEYLEPERYLIRATGFIKHHLRNMKTETIQYRALLIEAMKATFGDDQRRISHALSVLKYAEDILEGEKADTLTVTAAAILHDIGIREAERKHNSNAPRFQELEGPPIARKIMEKLGLEENLVGHVCRIVGSHHSAKEIDTPEFRIVWDADLLVNIPDEHANLKDGEMKTFIVKAFRTESGRKIAFETLWDYAP